MEITRRSAAAALFAASFTASCGSEQPSGYADASARSEGRASDAQREAEAADSAANWPAPARQLLRLGHGINLGNMLEAPEEGEWGQTIKEHYLAAIKDAGFDSVRVPIRWNAHALSQEPFTIDAAFLARVEQVVSWALAQGLGVLINVHHFEALYEDPAAHKTRFLAQWEQIAQRFAQRPPQLMFELLNEPHGALDAPTWNALLVDALAVVRKSNPRRAVVIGPVQWSSIAALEDLLLPDDAHLIASVHFYSPFWFTHSGASWVQGQPPGAVWNGDEAQRSELRAELQKASDWARERGGVPIYVGEFGAYERADHASRIRWTTFVVEEFNSRGFGWAYWEFCAGFGAYDPAAESWREDLLGALSP